MYSTAGVGRALMLDEDQIPTVMFGQMNQETVRGLNEINMQLMQVFPVSSTVMAANQAFQSAVLLDNSWEIRQAQAVMSNQQFINTIVPIQDLYSMRNASPVMQEWVNIHPEVHRRVTNGTLVGYDREPVCEGYRTEQWLQAVDGFMLPVTESGKVIYDTDSIEYDNYVYTIDFNRMKETEGSKDQLTYNDRRAILETWYNVDNWLKQGADPTDQEAEVW